MSNSRPPIDTLSPSSSQRSGAKLRPPVMPKRAPLSTTLSSRYLSATCGPSIGTWSASRSSAAPPTWSIWPWVSQIFSTVTPVCLIASKIFGTSPPGSITTAFLEGSCQMMVQFCSNSVTGTIIAPAFAWVSVLSSMAGTIFYREMGSTRPEPICGRFPSVIGLHRRIFGDESSKSHRSDRDFRWDAQFMDQASKSPLGGTRTTARAFFVSDRLNTSGLERGDVLATTPLAFRVNESGIAILFRYGVVVLIGLNALEEEEFLRSLQSRMTRAFARREEETATIELAAEREDQIPPGGPICLQSLSPERLILIGEALAKSVVLARHEREVASVFETTEPFARELARNGRMHGSRHSILKNIGNAQLVRHRVSGPVEVEEKPDVLWDKPHLERLYARLEDEYELKERAESVNRKLAVLAESAQVLNNSIDTPR